MQATKWNKSWRRLGGMDTILLLCWISPNRQASSSHCRQRRRRVVFGPVMMMMMMVCLCLPLRCVARRFRREQRTRLHQSQTKHSLIALLPRHKMRPSLCLSRSFSACHSHRVCSSRSAACNIPMPANCGPGKWEFVTRPTFKQLLSLFNSHATQVKDERTQYGLVRSATAQICSV